MITLEKIKFGYSKSSNLFDELSLNFEPGRIYGLLGKNGTGKTTLMKIMAGLLELKEGECEADGASTFKRLPNVLSDIFMVPEEFALPAIKMEQYVKINAPFYPNFSKADYETFAKEFELPANKKLSTLSYGQKKKFLLSFGLATNARLMFLDEPTNGLDIPSKSQLRKIVAMSVNENRSIIISTHQARDLESLIDTILIIEDGKIVFNHEYNAITTKLAFEKSLKLLDEESIIYKEEALGGYRIVRKTNSENDSLLDLELLFNAVIANHKEISNLFNN